LIQHDPAILTAADTYQATGLFAAGGHPKCGTGKQFFARKTGQAKPETVYHLWAGSVGGPVIKDRTFFWASTEGYQSLASQSAVLIRPTALERLGDHSQSPTITYDPRTTRLDPDRAGQFIRDPFPGNVIPADRINPVARSLVRLLPLRTTGHAFPSTARLADLTNQATTKVDHQLSEQHTLSGLFAWYHSNEPGFEYYGGVPGDPGAFSIPRTVNLVAVNAVSTPGRGEFQIALRTPINELALLGFGPSPNSLHVQSAIQAHSHRHTVAVNRSTHYEVRRCREPPPRVRPPSVSDIAHDSALASDTN